MIHTRSTRYRRLLYANNPHSLVPVPIPLPSRRLLLQRPLRLLHPQRNQQLALRLLGPYKAEMQAPE
jgi:hypothetical protein